MDQENFSSSISAHIDANEAISKISNIPAWWGVSFEGNAGRKDDTFVIKMGGDSFFNCTVEEMIPGKKLTWLVTDCNMPWYTDKKEWANTKLIFNLNKTNGATEVTFTHEGLTSASECYTDCAPGWTHWIQKSLFSYLTTGKGVFRAPTK